MEWIERRLCQEYGYSPPELRAESCVDALRYITVLGAESYVQEFETRKAKARR